MKKQSILATAAAATLMALGTASAQQVTTTPVGYKKETLVADAFNLVGVTLHEPTIISGAFDSVSGSILTDDDVVFDALLGSTGLYILEITSGAASGEIAELSNDGSASDNVDSNSITPMINTAIAQGDTYRIRKASTISAIFGATNQAGLAAGTTVASADVVWVPNGEGFDKYYYSPGQTVPFPVAAGWKTDTGEDASNRPVVYTDGMIIETQPGSAPTLTLTGEVVSSAKVIRIASGINTVGTVFPVGTKLSESNLQTNLQTGTTVATADVIWMSNGTGGFNKYFYNPGQTVPFPIAAGWKDDSGNDASDVVIPGAVFIERRGGQATISSTPSF